MDIKTRGAGGLGMVSGYRPTRQLFEMPTLSGFTRPGRGGFDLGSGDGERGRVLRAFFVGDDSRLTLTGSPSDRSNLYPAQPGSSS